MINLNQMKLLKHMSCDDRDGYNKWRDAKKPCTLLAELCRKEGIPSPEYRESAVKVLNKIFKIPNEDFPEGQSLNILYSLMLCIKF